MPCCIRATTIGTIGNASKSCGIHWTCYILLFAVQLCCILKPSVLIYVCPTRNIELKDNTVIVVLGASGDLAKKKTVGSVECSLCRAFTN
jgi:hypothetical protein